jgi:cytoskeletal protein CcmA (bactofilin family)
LITLNFGSSGTNTNDIGFLAQRGSSGNVALAWKEDQGLFAVYSTTSNSNTNGNTVVTAYSTFKAGNILADSSLSVNGTANISGNINTSANVNAGYFIGNGSQLTGLSTSIVYNGSSNVSIASSGGNITLSVAGNSNVLSISGAGANITGYANVSGNIYVGNILSSGFYYANGASFPTEKLTSSTSPPGSPNLGDQWYNRTNDVVYQWVTDGTSSFWLDISSIPSSTASFSTANLTVTSNFSVSNITVTNNLTVASNATFTNNITVGGNVLRGGTRINSTYFASSSAPTNPVLGDLWYYQANDILYVRAYDGTNVFWLDLTTQSNSFATLTAGNLSVTGNSNLTGTITVGNLASSGNLTVSGNSSISGTGTVTGNLTAGNLITTGNIYYANGAAFSSSKPAVSYFWGQIF